MSHERSRVMIECQGFGCIVIEGKRHTSDVIIFPDRVVSHWLRQTGHGLVPEDLERVQTRRRGRWSSARTTLG